MKKQEKAATNSKVAKEALAAARTAQTKNGKKSSYYPLNLNLKLGVSYFATPLPYIIKRLFLKHNATELSIRDIVEGISDYFLPYFELELDDMKLLSYLLIANELYPPFKNNGYVSRSYYAIKIDTGIESIGQCIQNLKDAGLVVVDSGYGKERANHYIFPSGVQTLLRLYLASVYRADTSVEEKEEKTEQEKFLKYQIALKNNQDIFGEQ